MTAHGARPDPRSKREGLGASVRLNVEDLAAQEEQIEKQGGIPLFPRKDYCSSFNKYTKAIRSRLFLS